MWRTRGPGLLGEYFQTLGWEILTVELYCGDSLPKTLDSAAGVVILGGPMNVYEEESYPFLRSEDQFIRQVLREEVPFLGICLGAQLLAKACGAAVTKSPHKEIGWFEAELTEAGMRDSLFRGLPGTLSVFQWHEDTFVVPVGASLLATSELCRNQAFKVGNLAYGLQFHLEVTPEMVRAWARKEASVDTKRIDEEGASQRGHFEAQAVCVFENFGRLIASTTRVKKTVRQFVETEGRKPARLWWSPSLRTLV